MSKAADNSVDRLHALCQQAAKGGPDPYAALLRAQFHVIEDCMSAVLAERVTLLDAAKVPELNPSYRERWMQFLGAIDVYNVAAQRAQPTPPSEWDGEAAFQTLVEQAGVVWLLKSEWLIAGEGSDVRLRNAAFARHALGEKTFLAGVVAVVPLGTDAARRLGIGIVGGERQK
jgi:hypothetical protein